MAETTPVFLTQRMDRAAVELILHSQGDPRHPRWRRVLDWPRQGRAEGHNRLARRALKRAGPGDLTPAAAAAVGLRFPGAGVRLARALPAAAHRAVLRAESPAPPAGRPA